MPASSSTRRRKEKDMMHIIRESVTPKQITEMSEVFGGLLIRLAVDVERGILAGGGELHADCKFS